jgi:hypothetical protein
MKLQYQPSTVNLQISAASGSERVVINRPLATARGADEKVSQKGTTR